MRVDLHIHTQASDGTWTPAQLVEHVRAAGIGLFAVADHDSIGSVTACEALVRGSGLRFLRAVEISTTWHGALYHIIAYGVNPVDQALGQLLAGNRRLLEGANRESLELLRQDGFPVDLAAYDAYASDPARGGWKGLNFLVDQGLCADVRDYFDRLFNANRPVPFPTFPPPAEVIATITAAGGVPILAHPGSPWLPIGDEVLEAFRQAGIRGLECYTSYHDAVISQRFVAWCQRHDLLITGGSDCHGDFAPGRKLGVPPIEDTDLRLGELEDAIIT